MRTRKRLPFLARKSIDQRPFKGPATSLLTVTRSGAGTTWRYLIRFEKRLAIGCDAENNTAQRDVV